MFFSIKSEGKSFHSLFISFILAFLVFRGLLYADNTPYIERIIKMNSPLSISLEKKMLILSKSEVNSISKKVKLKLNTTIYRTYLTYKDNKIEHKSIVLSRVVRTKKATVLYMIDKNGAISNIEILSFLEPKEYKPNTTWQKVFIGKTSKERLRAGGDIPTISGATMSARSITEGAKIALALAQMIK